MPHPKSKLLSSHSWDVPTALQRDVMQERVRGKGESPFSNVFIGPLTGRPVLECWIPDRKPASGKGIYQSSRCRPRGRARGERPDEPGSEPWPWRPDNTGREHGTALALPPTGLRFNPPGPNNKNSNTVLRHATQKVPHRTALTTANESLTTNQPSGKKQAVGETEAGSAEEQPARDSRPRQATRAGQG